MVVSLEILPHGHKKGNTGVASLRPAGKGTSLPGGCRNWTRAW